MNDADRNAIAFADQVISEQRPLWEHAASDLGIDINATPRPGSFEEKMVQMSDEEFLSSGAELARSQLKLFSE